MTSQLKRMSTPFCGYISICLYTYFHRDYSLYTYIHKQNKNNYIYLFFGKEHTIRHAACFFLQIYTLLDVVFYADSENRISFY